MWISVKERDAMSECERKNSWESADEGFNNEVAYNWETFGPSSYFGQEVTHWARIPDLPERI